MAATAGVSVKSDAAAAVPTDRRPWIPVDSVAATVAGMGQIPVDTHGEPVQTDFEALAATQNDPGAKALWRGAAGEAAAHLLSEMIRDGAGITLAPAVLYPYYLGPAHQLGVDPHTDQQIAGLIMWVPGDALFAGILMALFIAYLRQEGRSAERIDRELDARELLSR